MRTFGKLLLLLGVISSLSGCSHTNNRQETITAVGSSALQPLIEAGGEKYSQKNPQAYINVQGGGSGTGLAQIQQGAVAIGNSDVFAEQKKGIQAQNLIDHKVCVVAVVPVVNRQVPLNNLSTTQLQAIFMGKITNWQQVGGPRLPITIINRAQGSGTRMIFEQQVMQGQPFKKAPEQDSSGMVRQIVKNTPGAISYVAWPYLTQDLKPLAIDQIKLTTANVAQNHWKIWAYEHLYTTKNPNKLTRQFIKFILSEQFQEQEVRQMHYIPMKQMRYQQDAHGRVSSKE